MRRLFDTLAVLLVFLSATGSMYAAESVWDGKTIATGFYGGTGTKSNPYTIYTASQFAYFYKEMANGRTFEGQYISLKNDIDMTSTQLAEMDGVEETYFNFYGHFNGEDHSLAAKQGYFGYSGPRIFDRVYGTICNVVFSKYPTHIAYICSGGEMYNCKLEKAMMMAISSDYGGTVANCYCNDYDGWKNGSKYGGASGLLSGSGNCLNCQFTGMSYISYGGSTASNYGGSYRECNDVSDEEHNQWVREHNTTDRKYKNWPLIFNPTYPSYTVTISHVDESGFTNYSSVNITAGSSYTLPVPTGFESEFVGWEVNGEIVKSLIPTDNIICRAVWEHSFVQQPTFLNPTVLPKDKSKAMIQWYRMPARQEILSNDITTINVQYEKSILEFDYSVYSSSGGYSTSGYDGYIKIDNTYIVFCEDDKSAKGHYKLELSEGVHTISRSHATTTNMVFSYPSTPIGNPNACQLDLNNITSSNGVFYCEASYGTNKIYSDTLDTSDLFYAEEVLYARTSTSEATLLRVKADYTECFIPLMVTNNNLEYIVTGISDYAFAGCSALKKIVCMQTTPLTIGASAVSSVFQNVDKSACRLLVPTSSVSKYKTAIGWRDFSTIKSSTIMPVKIYLGSSLAISKNTDIDEILEQDVSHNGLVYIDDQDVDQTLPSNFIKKDESNLWIASSITLTDAQTLYVPDDVKTDVLTYSRTFSNTDWQALYVPFEMSVEDWQAQGLEMARINNAHQYDYDYDGKIDATAIEVIMLRSGLTEPNTPYLVRAIEPGQKVITLFDTWVYKTEENSFDVSSWNTLFTFTGTYQGVKGAKMLSEGYYAMGGGSIHQTTSAENDLKPMRWYMDVTDRKGNKKPVNEVKVLVFGEDDIETGIYRPETDVNGDAYDLSGRRLTGTPARGLYIQNGKKYIKK